MIDDIFVEEKAGLPESTLFGEDPRLLLKDNLGNKFLESPFTVLNANSSNWIKRKKAWKRLGIKSEEGRDGFETFRKGFGAGPKYGNRKALDHRSIFDPVLCELMYRWFCPDGGAILDPFAGGSVRGIVAHFLGYKYCGIDLRQEQIEANYKNASEIFLDGSAPKWISGDSNEVLDSYNGEVFDFIFSCPPYFDLEVYSRNEKDISNMTYEQFLEVYNSIIAKSVKLLKPNSFACFVVGEIRDKKTGFYRGFVPDTIKAFEKAGTNFYNDAIIVTSLGTTMLRTKQFATNRKLVKTHQNVLIFVKEG